MNKWRVAARRCALLCCEAVFHFTFTIFHAIFLCFLIENFYLACLAVSARGKRRKRWRGEGKLAIIFTLVTLHNLFEFISMHTPTTLTQHPLLSSALHPPSALPPLPLRSGWNGSFSWLMANNCKYLIHNKAIKIKLKFSLCARRAPCSCCCCCCSPRCCCLLLLSSLSRPAASS